MGRARKGSIYRDSAGLLHARVTWTEGKKRYQRKRRAFNEDHARSICADMILQMSKRGRIQPSRARHYRCDNRYIYCIQILDGAKCPIKIGITNDVAKRTKMLLTHLPYEVKLLGSWPGTVTDERAVHYIFAECRIVREWFRPTPELLAYIASKNWAEVAA